MKHEGAKFGDIGEKMAENYLISREFAILERKYRKKYGEIDLITRKGDAIRFIEVKSSYFYPDTSFPPEIRVNFRKARKLKKICEIYLQEHSVPKEQAWQIDVISVLLKEDNSLHNIEHIENAVFEKQY